MTSAVAGVAFTLLILIIILSDNHGIHPYHHYEPDRARPWPGLHINHTFLPVPSFPSSCSLRSLEMTSSNPQPYFPGFISSLCPFRYPNLFSPFFLFDASNTVRPENSIKMTENKGGISAIEIFLLYIS